jgi:ubiquinone/menaquinone biosynthesis C-methylase UbiE
MTAMRYLLPVRCVATALLLFVLASTSNAQRSRPDPLSNNSRIPPGKTEYMGRPIAQTMHYSGAEWLIRNTREREERCARMLANMGIERGISICDMGCGNGFYSLKMAKLVGPKGRVLAVDIQPEMLALLRNRAEAEGIDNISPILGSLNNPRLPTECVDLILLVDVYHEFSHPESMLWSIRRSLTSTGVVALLEYREEDPQVPIKRLHKMSKHQIMKEYHSNGFKLVREYNRLPWQHLMFFARDDSPLAEIEPVPAQQVLEDLE